MNKSEAAFIKRAVPRKVTYRDREWMLGQHTRGNLTLATNGERVHWVYAASDGEWGIPDDRWDILKDLIGETVRDARSWGSLSGAELQRIAKAAMAYKAKSMTLYIHEGGFKAVAKGDDGVMRYKGSVPFAGERVIVRINPRYVKDVVTGAIKCQFTVFVNHKTVVLQNTTRAALIALMRR